MNNFYVFLDLKKSNFEGRITDDMPSTIGASFQTLRIEHDNRQLAVGVWDTAGQERYHSLTPMYYRGSHMVYVVFDVTDSHSFKAADMWRAEVRQACRNDLFLVLVGNKIDLPENYWCVSREEFDRFAEQFDASYWVSAKNSAQVRQMFQECAIAAARRFTNDKNNNNDNNNILNINSYSPIEVNRNSFCLSFFKKHKIKKIKNILFQ